MNEAALHGGEADAVRAGITGVSPGAQAEPLDERFAWASRLMGFFVLSVGAAVLLGWAFDVSFLKSLHSGFVAMKPNTALGFVLLGLALTLGRGTGERHLLALNVLGALVALIGAVTLAEYALGVDLRIDRLLFREPAGAVLTEHPGRMSVVASLSLLMLGLAVIRRRTDRFASPLAAVTFVVALVALAGYGYGVTAFYDLGYPTPLSLHAAATFLLASTAVLLARTDAGFGRLMVAGGAGGFLARRWLPLMLALPFAVELAVKVGARWRLNGSAHPDAVHAVLLAGALVAVLYFMARRLERSDQERLRMLAALRASEARHRALSENMSLRLDVIRRLGNDILLLIATDGSLVQVNDRAIETYRYSEEELLRLNIRDLRAAESRVTVDEVLQRALAADGTRFETVHRRRDGSTFPAEVSARAVEINGKLYLQGIVRDLSDERAARAAVEYQAMLLDNLYDAVIGIDAGSVVTAWNRAAELVFGWAREEVLGRPLLEFLPSEYPGGASLEDVLSKVAREGRIKSVVRRRTRAGEWLDIESTAAAIRGPQGVVVGYVSVNHDISQRKRAEEALRASQQRLHDILQNANDGIWVIDSEGKTELANSRLLDLLQVREDDMVGRSYLDAVHAEHRAGAMADREAVERGETIHREFTIRRSDQSEIRVLMSRNPLLGEQGRVVGDIAVFTDITAHRRAEKQLLQAQKMEAVGQLASGIAHDFNNLLVVILSNARFLVSALPEGDERREDADGIQEAGERAARLVRQLLTFSRKVEARPVVTSLATVLGGLESLLRRTLSEDVTMSVSFPPEPWLIRIDPGQLEQVLMNLVLNARDAMPHGGQLRIEAKNEVLAEPPPDCADLPPGKYAVLSVTDTGCGMTSETISRIFEPFFTTKSVGKGTGLGLSMVFGIVEQAHGKIGVASEPGRGSTFTIYLPVCDGTEERDLVQSQDKVHHGRKETVLLVEDEEAVRRAARRMLERNGFRVIEACHGEEALRVLEAHGRMDVILSDVVMPELSGKELVHAVARSWPEIPVVLMSGYAQDAAALPGVILAKPFTEGTLAVRLREAIAAGPRFAAPYAISPTPTPSSARVVKNVR